MKTTPFFLFLILFAVACNQPATNQLLVLHTNDTHSQVEPISKGARNGDMAGYVRRFALIDSIRNTEATPLLLVDAGDFSQGTPYFNVYHGRIEVEAMNKMKYDAVALGNHEFDYGVDTLAEVLKSALFPVVCCNYDVSKTPLSQFVKPYVVLSKGGLKVGITGVGVNPDGLIYDKNFEGVVYNEPYSSVNDVASHLKTKEHCDVVICLSHLGAEYEDPTTPSDVQLAMQSQHVDAIIGGHTHSYMQKKVANVNGDSIPVVQVGKSGAYLGKLKLHLGN